MLTADLLVDIIIVARAEFQLWIRELSAKNDRTSNEIGVFSFFLKKNMTHYLGEEKSL